MKHTATITKGQLLFDNLLHWLDYAKLNAGKKVSVEVIRQKRSNPQNNYYHAMCDDIYKELTERASEESGYTCEELKEMFKDRFLSRTVYIKGKPYKFTRSTSDLNTAEFEEYLSKIRQLASIEWGCYVKLPNEE